ncbi:prefoldin subunit 5 [Lysobacter sp. OAE881]|uniref:portal protein n=1 Tax=Lysobacter sp. OAE881 TaxID=2663813 RepID=UPI0033914D7F
MKEQRKKGKDAQNSDPMAEMRQRYDRAVEADRTNRDNALDDLRFVTVPGYQWDEQQRKARKGRACYEFPILRSHWRQVVNDQKKARPGIKVRAVEDGDAKGAELRQGLIRNIESSSNAERAYDGAFELVTAGGMGSWRVVTQYSSDDAWEQDLRIKPIPDPLTSVWHDPDAKEPDLRDQRYCFVEESIPRDEFKARYPKAECVDFDSAKRYGDWFQQDHVRIAEYWRLVPVTKTILLLSDGRSVDQADITPEAAQKMAAEGISVVRERQCKGHKVVMSIVSGAEELEGPHDTVFDRIPVVSIFANRFFIEGKWHWCGMVRFSRDPQKLLNYNLTTAQEVVSKQPKAPYLVTPKMLEGDGVKAMWDRANAIDAPYLPYTPDPQAPQARPVREAPPDMPAAFTMLTQISVDMLKASDGIYDASVGAKSNETSGKAIIARQREGDTATYDYQDSLAFGIQATGEIILAALPKVYDTPRTIRVLGKDGAEDIVEINKGDGVTDLSAGKYDVTVTTGPSYDTQRMEFIDALTALGQGNPAIAAGVPDLIVGAMDFPKAEEAAERLKLLLPPPVQAAMAQGKDMPPEIIQARQQVEQGMAEVQQRMAALDEVHAELMQDKAKVDSAKSGLDAQVAEIHNQRELLAAAIKQGKTEMEVMHLRWELQQTRAQAAQSGQGSV